MLAFVDPDWTDESLNPIVFNISRFHSGRELRASTHRSFGPSGCFSSAGLSSTGSPGTACNEISGAAFVGTAAVVLALVLGMSVGLAS